LEDEHHRQRRMSHPSQPCSSWLGVVANGQQPLVAPLLLLAARRSSSCCDGADRRGGQPFAQRNTEALLHVATGNIKNTF